MNNIFLRGYLEKEAKKNLKDFYEDTDKKNSTEYSGHAGEYDNQRDVIISHMDDMGIRSPKQLDRIIKKYKDTDEYDPRLTLFLEELGYGQLKDTIKGMDKRAFVEGYIDKEAVIKQEGNEWVLYNKDQTKVLGRHSSKEEAEAQERAIKANE